MKIHKNNSSLYVINDYAPKTYLYFRIEDKVINEAAGSIFSRGYYAAAVLGGAVLCTLDTLLAVKLKKRKRKYRNNIYGIV